MAASAAKTSASVDAQVRVPELDGVRGMAVAAVMLLHFTSNPTKGAANALERAYLFAVGHLWCGVNLFFVLSGFLITGILLKSADRSDYFLEFYRRRALRILPLAFTTIAAWFWIGIPALRWLHVPKTFGHGISVGVQSSYDQIWFFLFLQNWPWVHGSPVLAHLWTLAIEEQFYLIWPFAVLLWGKNSRLVWVSLGLVLVSLYSRIALVAADHIQMASTITFAQMDGLALGALIAIARRHRRQISGWWVWGAAAVLVYVLVLEALGRAKATLLAVEPTCFSSIFAGLVTIAASGDPRCSVFRLNFLRRLGKHSYALYVIHYPIHLVLHQALRGRFDFWAETGIMLVLGSSLSWLLALGSWKFIESPMLARK